MKSTITSRDTRSRPQTPTQHQPPFHLPLPLFASTFVHLTSRRGALHPSPSGVQSTRPLKLTTAIGNNPLSSLQPRSQFFSSTPTRSIPFRSRPYVPHHPPLSRSVTITTTLHSAPSVIPLPSPPRPTLLSTPSRSSYPPHPSTLLPSLGNSSLLTSTNQHPASATCRPRQVSHHQGPPQASTRYGHEHPRNSPNTSPSSRPQSLPDTRRIHNHQPGHSSSFHRRAHLNRTATSVLTLRHDVSFPPIQAPLLYPDPPGLPLLMLPKRNPPSPNPPFQHRCIQSEPRVVLPISTTSANLLQADRSSISPPSHAVLRTFVLSPSSLASTWHSTRPPVLLPGVSPFS